MNKPLVVLKFGSSSIIQPNGEVNATLMESIAKSISVLRENFQLLMVSSGAVGLGRKSLKQYTGKINERKAAAAIGNPILMEHFRTAFSKYKLELAQTLCERTHFSNRAKFLQLRETINTLWKNDIIPIANENDVVSSHELKFSDNDELATLMAIGLNAKHLLLGTSVKGLLDKNKNLVKTIDEFSSDILNMATGEKSAFGLGGMVSKITYARLATSMGIHVVIFDSNAEDAIGLALQKKIGTQCLPKTSSKGARQKWLASGSLVAGKVIIDKGAAKALLNRKSLLSVGVVEVISSFEKGEVIEIGQIGNEVIGVARTKLSSETLKTKIGEPNIEVAHANDIVIL